MKKRLVQSLILGIFLLVITFAAKRETKADILELNIEGPRAGACDLDIGFEKAEIEDNVIIATAVPFVPPIETTELYLSYLRMGFSREKFYEDLDLLAAITMAEAGNQSELGKRLVIDTVLNRIDSDCWRDDDIISEVVSHPYQFETYTNGAYTRVSITEDIPVLVEQEIISRTNSDVIYFKTNGYFAGVPSLFKEGEHYFSTENRR